VLAGCALSAGTASATPAPGGTAPERARLAADAPVAGGSPTCAAAGTAADSLTIVGGFGCGAALVCVGTTVAPATGAAAASVATWGAVPPGARAPDATSPGAALPDAERPSAGAPDATSPGAALPGAVCSDVADRAEGCETAALQPANSSSSSSVPPDRKKHAIQRPLSRIGAPNGTYLAIRHAASQ